MIVDPEIEKSQPEGWERAYSKLFRVLFACGVAFFAYLYLKDWAIGLEQARERGDLGAVLLRTGTRSLPLVAFTVLLFYLKKFPLPIDRVLSKGRIFLFVYDFVIFFLAYAAVGFLAPSFWSWSFLLIWPLGFSAVHAIFAEAPRSSSSDGASQPRH
jgi:hypothetical protein